MKKFYISLLSLAILTATGSSAEAKIFSKKEKAPQKVEKKVQKQTHEVKKTDYIDILNLTDEQKDFYHQIRRSEFEQMSPILTKIKEKHKELEALMASDMPPMIYDVEEVKIKNDLKKYREEIREIKILNEEKIEAILTDKQKKEYHKLKEQSFKTPQKKTVSRSMNSVSTTKEFVYEPCNGEGMPACKIDDLLKKQAK